MRKTNQSWFYKNFIRKTINDNFYTASEILKKQKKIIEKSKQCAIKEGLIEG